MGCISSKVLAKSGSFQEKVSLRHSFQRSNVIEEIILSSSKSNGDQFLALLCASSNSSARKANDLEQSPAAAAAAAAAAAESAAKIETINLSELLVGLEEENAVEQCGREDGNRSPAQCAPEGGAAGRARSFRTVEELDALLMLSSASERATAALAPQQESRIAAAATSATAESNGSSGQEEPAGQGGSGPAGANRRARARQLGELKVPPAFDFSKSGSLRDWLRQGGQTFSPGSYVTPKFGTATVVPAEHGGCETAGKQQEQEQAVFDPELVAQFERAMERLSEDEERALEEILEALELDLDAGEEEVAASLGTLRDQAVAAVQE